MKRKTYFIKVISSFVTFQSKPSLIDVKLPSNDDCWICTSHGGKNYPRVGSGRKSVLIYKILWEKKNGKVPKGKILLTTCKNWQKCINPNHRILGTRIKLAHQKMHLHRPFGESHHLHKLTDRKVRTILKSKLSDIALAKRYDCSDVTINRVRHRKIWKHIKTEEERWSHDQKGWYQARQNAGSYMITWSCLVCLVRSFHCRFF